jgi:phosphatidylserine/phosphatidylglycerophosphate/cardiolipin synthase-like enzyme
MRVRATNGDLSVHAVAGTYVILLGINVRDGSPLLNGLLGFAIHKTRHTTNRAAWLPGLKRFRGTGATQPPAQLASSRQQPLQTFLWADYAAEAGHDYTYRIVPIYGTPGALTEGASVEVRVRAEAEAAGAHDIYFNRGAAASQAYARRFQNRPPDRTANPEAYPWLSRGLEEALLAFIGRATGRGWGLRAAVYEFHYQPVLDAFRQAADRGADVAIVYDAKSGAGKPRARNADAIETVGLDDYCTPRQTNSSYIAHNKFIVLLRRGEPEAVWTGSTNVSEGGIFGHSNVGHVIRDPGVARRFLDYWRQLEQDPAAGTLRTWTDRRTPVPTRRRRSGIVPLFSPRSSLEALEFYADLMDSARSSVFFTAAFGVNRLLRRVLAKDKPYLRYLLLEREDKDDPGDPDIALYKRDRENLIAVGSHLTDDVLEDWVARNFAEEELTGTNKHVKYVHTKYMLIDPLETNPIVITGSANFSNASTRNNDENMLVIYGDTRVADIYLGEFMRLYTHYRFRAFARQAELAGRTPDKLFLHEDDAWLRPYYRAGSVKSQERMLFG